MSNELTYAQCADFLKRHPGVKVEYNNSDYCIVRHWDKSRGDEFDGVSLRRDMRHTITEFCKTFYPDWTPPVEDEWTAEKALEYAEKKHLLINCHVNGDYSISIAGPDMHPWILSKGGTLIQTIRKWKRINDPDKPEPTREETAIEFLKKLHSLVFDYPLQCEIDTFLKAAGTDAGSKDNSE